MSEEKTYGFSLYELAKEEGLSDEILEDLTEITAVFKENPSYPKLLNSPYVKHEERIKILDEDFKGRINRYTLNFLKILSEKHKIGCLDECFDVYTDLYNKDNNIKIVKVTTAKPLSNELFGKLQSKLEKKTGARVILKTRVDEKCIGGIIIETDGMRKDLSIKSGLEELKKALI